MQREGYSGDQNTRLRGEIDGNDKTRVRVPRLSPISPVTVITNTGLGELMVEDISPELIGWKAYGLASIPAKWVPPFLVIYASCFQADSADERINGWVAEWIKKTGVHEPRQLIVRSSGTAETIKNRGQLLSKPCSPQQVASTIRNLLSELSQRLGGKVHWVVQEYVNSREKGLLSNERRISLEKRDWIAEFEPQGDRPGYTTPIAFRPWRDGTAPAELDLRCTSALEVTLRLKLVAMWATSLPSRTLFEWVWNGKTIHIVQADEEMPPNGINPESLLGFKIPTIKLASLKVFHLATTDDYDRYAKLRNVRLYRELGYHMPDFYVVDDTEILDEVLSGHISPKLDGDLSELTKRPLIIRTDGMDIPEEKREMLPRSEELRSYAQARDWLLLNLKSRMEENGLTGGGLCLIAHHFIPSVASAWARAEPGNRIVRIESLWGIPEGLYWHSHDTFEVDTQTVKVNFGRPNGELKFRAWKRRRFKGTFIASDENGKWMPCQTAPPYDWHKSISKNAWLFEIAHTTRQVAEREKYAVSLMWFVDNHPQATEHAVLPWFHSRSQPSGTPKAAPRHKRKVTVQPLLPIVLIFSAPAMLRALRRHSHGRK